MEATEMKIYIRDNSFEIMAENKEERREIDKYFEEIVNRFNPLIIHWIHGIQIVGRKEMT